MVARPPSKKSNLRFTAFSRNPLPLALEACFRDPSLVLTMFPKRKHSVLETTNLLELAPVRIAPWKEDEGRVVLERPPPFRRGFRKYLDWLSCSLAVRRIRLDEFGSCVWKHLDGVATVAEVAEALRAAFGDSAEPVEERLGTFVRILRQQDLLAYPGFDELPDYIEIPSSREADRGRRLP